MTHERCECGGEAKLAGLPGDYWVWCEARNACWFGPNHDTPDAAWAAWDRVMKAVREARESHETHERLHGKITLTEKGVEA
jgi:hypothetical protein